MNEIVSFTKEIEFNTNIDKITSISLEHTISPDGESNIKGDLIVSGTYKQSPLLQIDSPFSYKIPVDIVLDSKYDITNMIIDIDNFTYEVEDNKLKVNIDLILDKLEIKGQEEVENLNDLFLEEEKEEKLEVEEKKEVEEKDCTDENTSESLFSNFDTNNETYSTYSVYIVRENDSMDDIMNKYHVSKSELEEYNNLDQITTGTKLIIPNNND